MSAPFTRNLIIQSNDLGKEVTIMFALINSDMQSLYQDRFPTFQSFRVSKFGKTGAHRTQLTYTNHRLFIIKAAFTKAQVADGNFISAGTSIKVNPGQKTTLTEANDVFSFSSPQSGSPGFVQAMNNTGSIQDIAVGFLNKGDFVPTPALYFDDVGDGSQVTAQLTPILRAIETPAIWSQDLTGLAQHTAWNLKRDPSSGRYTLVHA
ncbi:hypothetical protein BD769DRAFT_1429612 [Suillus cothurnatus]|nr:hypothetical protein BD769DRAFT_1429612 [Suillus cothurnatus]